MARARVTAGFKWPPIDKYTKERAIETGNLFFIHFKTFNELIINLIDFVREFE